MSSRETVVGISMEFLISFFFFHDIMNIVSGYVLVVMVPKTEKSDPPPPHTHS